MAELQTIFNSQVSGLPLPSTTKDQPILICLAGYPDTPSVWNPLTSHFETSHHIIALGLPGMNGDKLPRDKKWGYTFDELVSELHEVVKHCRRSTTTIHMIGHDWGSQICYLYQGKHPDMITKFASLDAGMAEGPDMSLKNALVGFSYIFFFTTVFALQNVVGTVASKLIDLYPWSLIGPLNQSETRMFLATPRKAPHTLYPYYQFMRDMPAKQTSNPVRVDWSVITQSTKHCFLYGTDKNTAFHSSVWLQAIDKTPGCFWKAMIGGGHWFYTTPKFSADVAKTLSGFFLG